MKGEKNKIRDMTVLDRSWILLPLQGILVTSNKFDVDTSKYKQKAKKINNIKIHNLRAFMKKLIHLLNKWNSQIKPYQSPYFNPTDLGFWWISDY